MRILVLLAIVGAAYAAPSFVAPYSGSVAALPEPAPAHVAVAGLPPVTYISRHHAQDELGQVNYGFSHPGQVKNEVRDALGNVAGAYSYIDADNKPVHVQYTAGFDGFQVRSNNLPVGPGALDAPEPVRDTPEVFSAKQEFAEAYKSAAIAAAAAPDDEVVLKPVVYSAPAAAAPDDEVVLKAAVESAVPAVATAPDDEVVLKAAVDSAVPAVATAPDDEVVLNAAVDSAAPAADAAPDDEVVLKAAVDSADAVFADEFDEELETATMLGVVAYSSSSGDEEPDQETGKETPAAVEIKLALELNEETAPQAYTSEIVQRVSVEDAEIKQEPEPEETFIETSETHYSLQGVPDETAGVAPLPEFVGAPAQTVSIEPLEFQPTLEADNNVYYRTIEVSELFPTSEEAAPIPATDTSEVVDTLADFQAPLTSVAVAATAEGTPNFNLDGSSTRYSGYLSPAHGSLSPLYNNILPYGTYGVHVPALLPYTVAAPTRQPSRVVAQAPMPYYRFVPQKFIYPVPYASQFLNYVPARDC